MNKELITRKSHLILALEAAKCAKENRKILDLASEAAALEGRIARDLILEDRSDDALVNLISQASCLGDAKRLTEKQRVLHFAAVMAIGRKAEKWIQDELKAIGEGHSNPADVFSASSVDIDNNGNLRRPQKGAYHAARDFFSRDHKENHAIVQLPVGCGKTGAMAILPFGISRGRVLVVAPNVIIRDNLQKNLDSYRDNSFLRKTGVLKGQNGPTCATLDEQANIRDCDEAAIVVTNIQQLVSGARSKWLDKLSP